MTMFDGALGMCGNIFHFLHSEYSLLFIHLSLLSHCASSLYWLKTSTGTSLSIAPLFFFTQLAPQLQDSGTSLGCETPVLFSRGSEGDNAPRHFGAEGGGVSGWRRSGPCPSFYHPRTAPFQSHFQNHHPDDLCPGPGLCLRPG